MEDKRVTTITRFRETLETEECHLQVNDGTVKSTDMTIGKFCDLVVEGRNQLDVYLPVSKRIEQFLQGSNISFIFIGPTKGGKSFSLFGHEERLEKDLLDPLHGLLPRTIKLALTRTSGQEDYTLYISALEAPLEGNPVDLLDENPPSFEVTPEGKWLLKRAKIRVTSENASSVLRSIVKRRTLVSSNSGGSPSSPHSLFIILELYYTDRHTGRITQSRVEFVELANSLIHNPYTSPPTYMMSDELFISYLNPNLALTPLDADKYFIFCTLRMLFNSSFIITVVCCLSPAREHVSLTFNYIKLMFLLTSHYSPSKMPILVPSFFAVPPAPWDLQTAFENLSTSEESHARADVQDQNAPTMPLECIEEVTESEEEIASSDGKVSRTPNSLDNSLSTYESESESGEADTETKLVQSETDFSLNLEDFVQHFFSLTDQKIDHLQLKSVQAPVTKRKQSCPAERRGGLPGPQYLRSVSSKNTPTGEGPSHEDDRPPLRCAKMGFMTTKPVAAATHCSEEVDFDLRLSGPQKNPNIDLVNRAKTLFAEVERRFNPTCSYGPPKAHITEEEIQLLQVVCHDLELLLKLAENSESNPLAEDYEARCRVNELRFNSKGLEHLMMFTNHEIKTLKGEYTEEEMNDKKSVLMYCEEIQCAIDEVNTFINYFILNKPRSFEWPMQESEVKKTVCKIIKTFDMREIRHLLMVFFQKAVDYRRNAEEHANATKNVEIELGYADLKCSFLQTHMNKLREEIKALKDKNDACRCAGRAEVSMLPSQDAVSRHQGGSIPSHNLTRLLSGGNNSSTKATFEQKMANGKRTSKLVLTKKN